jgi:23S rRNA A1618 N6-methylase RlmF
MIDVPLRQHLAYLVNLVLVNMLKENSLKPNGQLDFSDPKSVQQLTKSLLKRDFNLSLSLPPNRLCPPVRVSLIYIILLIKHTSPEKYKGP